MPPVLAADLGGTKCRFALVTADGKVAFERGVATPHRRAAFVAMLEDELAAVVSLAGPRYRPYAIGIGTAGLIAPDHESIALCPNLPVAGYPLGRRLRGRFGIPAVLINDGRASAIGEHLRGKAKGKDPLLVLFFGTGIGIGLIAGGKPFEGASNSAGEIGHTVHVPGGRLCPCGNRGCYEAYCGGGPILARAARELGAAPEGRWSLAALRTAARQEPRARAILAEAERAATALVASACTLLNPAAVVLGGGVIAKGWPALFGKIERFARSFCSPSVTKRLRFVTALDGSKAILIGAAGFARQALAR